MTSVDQRPWDARTLEREALSPATPRWQDLYRRRVAITDVVVIVLAVVLAHVLRFGEARDSVAVSGDAIGSIDYLTVSILLMASWAAFLAAFGVRAPQVVGSGAEEYRRVLSASMRLFGAIAIVALLLRLDVARGYLAIALPIGLLGLLGSRFAWRSWAERGRRSGRFTTSVLVVGTHRAATTMAAAFERNASSGCRVVGACVPGNHSADDLDVGGHRVPVLGSELDVVSVLRRTGASMVAVTATEHLGAEGLRQLLWDLEPLGADMVVAPGVADVAVPRLTLHPIGDLSLLHVEKPRYQGATRLAKSAFDMCFSLLALIAVAPIVVMIAAVIKLDDAGPVFYRSERMGLDGRPFSMLKFRTMVTDADRRVEDLLAHNDSGGGVLFKMKRDPRVTRVGRVLRRYSLDELPQFVNVLRREMSVVGPRPPLRREVETYDGHIRRRLLVRPGVTGLWQVSGRSDLSWEETVRLDLSYVENWSMTQDLSIIARTVRAVVGSEGAY